ncbi:hypothetical protein BE04_21890 [Sorangium cellulosum]|uniref:Uncharacterized protein n=2 Tax=Sorangium cellulosum TaxID=56 RepID=A0A150Q7R9_SORCE|nr:hypothetical protein SCE1572_37030 [Sorangium cellulosum So0157-2]KYF64029.1 hypothetical protein BE04_21890 [Sorangium cellulosum]
MTAGQERAGGEFVAAQSAKGIRRTGSTDALAIDITAARHMGVISPTHFPIPSAACAWFGDPARRSRSQARLLGAEAPLSSPGWTPAGPTPPAAHRR